MAGLPLALKGKLETLRQEESSRAPVILKPNRRPTAVASMTPGPPTPPPTTPEGELDLDRFSVQPQATVPPTEAPRAPEVVSSPEEEEAAFDAEWKARDPKGFHKYKTVAGMFERSKQDVRDLKESLNGLKDEIKALRDKPAAPVVAPTPPPVATRTLEEELDASESNYLPAVPVVKKLGTRIAKEVSEQIVAPLQDRIAGLEAKITNLESGQTNLGKVQFQNEEQGFVGQVKARVPEFDKIIDDPEWKELMHKPVPYTDMTFGQALATAHEKRNLKGVLQIFESFRPTKPSSVDDLASPPVRANGHDPTRVPVKPVLKASERRKASEDFRKKRITQDEFKRIADLYSVAEKEGRIDWNA